MGKFLNKIYLEIEEVSSELWIIKHLNKILNDLMIAELDFKRDNIIALSEVITGMTIDLSEKVKNIEANEKWINLFTRSKLKL